MKTFPLLCAAIAFFFAAATSSLQALTWGDFTYTATATEVTITGYNTTANGAVTIPDTIGGQPVTGIGDSAFDSCVNITQVAIPSSVNNIGVDVFKGCSILNTIAVDAGNANFSSVGGVLFDKNQTALIRFPANNLVTTYAIPTSVTRISSSAFQSCTKLTSVTIPAAVTRIENYTFQGCANLGSTKIPNGVTSIGSYAFNGCNDSTFNRISIPSSVTSIGDSAFYNCNILSAIYFNGNAPTVGGSVFYRLYYASDPTVYYSVEATNFGATFAGRPTALYAKPVITAQPVGAIVNQGASKSFSVTATGATAYQWQKDGIDISGATAATLSLSSVQAANAGNYTVIASNYMSITSSSVALTAVSTLNSVTVNQGSSATFSVTVTGGDLPAYQWKKAGVNIVGATSATLSLGNVQTADAGSYTVTVTNAAGTVTSNAATLTVITPPVISNHPVSATVNQGASASFSVTATGTTPTYQWQKDGVDLAGATAATLSLINVQAANAGNYTVTVSNAAGTVTSNSATLKVIVPPVITTQPVSVTANLGLSASFSVTTTGTSPTYQWKKAGVNITGATTATLSFVALLTTDAGSYTVVVTNAAGTVTSSTVTLTVISPPTISLQPVSVSPNLGASASLSVTATGGAPYTYQWKKDGTDVAGATAATLSFATLLSTDAGSYTVVVTNAAGAVTSNTAILTVVVVPTIAAQPVSINSNQGASATFSVTAAGGGTYTYQWKKAGVNITGATAATLTLSNVQPTDAAAYSVTVTNAMGTVTSNAATLAVIVPPFIVDQPTNIIANPGEGAVFSVVTTGSAPTYQWKRNGVIVAGATQADLNFTAIQPVHVGSYKVVVTNAAGSVTSATVSLTLNTVFTQSQYDVIADAARAEILDSPNGHGLYSLNQVQVLNVGTPLLARDTVSKKFKLTVKAKKSTDLKTFTDLPFSAGDAVINSNGEMEFQFASPDNAAFFRIESH